MSLLVGFGRALTMLAVAPLAVGVTKRVKARCQGRRGPPLLQGYYDLAKWARKDRVVSNHASPLFLVTPYALLATTCAAATLVPTAVRAEVGLGDVFLFVGLLGLGRFLLALAGLEAGSAFGGMASSREMALSALVEPGFVLALGAPALAAGTGLPAGIAATGAGLHAGAPAGVWAGMLLAAAGLFVISIAETGRIPVDNPDTHLELTMVHEGMVLEYSGRELAAVHLAAAGKQALLLSLWSALFLPWGMAAGAAAPPSAWVLGGAAWIAKILGLSALLGLVETANVKMRLFRVPEILAAAFLLALAGAFFAGGATP